MDGTGMNICLPEDFTERMRQQLGDELSAFLNALEEPPVRGIRMNPLKPSDAVQKYTQHERIPWTEDGFYLPEESEAGMSILHAAGAFYIQEPGAMLPAAVLNARPGEKVLDLCAAPGGKSTQIGCAMRGEGLLVCNEPVPRRAQILSGNIERMGLPNTVVTCATPDQLAEMWPEGFDAVLVDAPCSGEGMFRREPETRKEWSPEKAAGCAARQKEILEAAARLVRPGGRLVYSTCTYNPAENEENARWFTERFHQFTALPFSLYGIEAPDGIFTCYPHRLKGEGQFTAAFSRRGNTYADLPPDGSLQKPSKAETDALKAAFPGFPEPTHLFGKTMVSIAQLPDLKGIRTLRTGLHLGEVRGKVCIPDHASALCFFLPDLPALELSPEDAVRFMAGETITGNASGWILVRYHGLALGWGKGSGGTVKNHYPKGLRTLRSIP